MPHAWERCCSPCHSRLVLSRSGHLVARFISPSVSFHCRMRTPYNLIWGNKMVCLKSFFPRFCVLPIPSCRCWTLHESLIWEHQLWIFFFVSAGAGHAIHLMSTKTRTMECGEREEDKGWKHGRYDLEHWLLRRRSVQTEFNWCV
jgi:hypothetical protein